MDAGTELVLDTDVAECGGVFRGRVSGNDVTLELTMTSSGVGGTETVVVATAPAGPGHPGFELPVPVQGPISYDGELFSLAWVVAVRATGPATPVTVLPAGGLALWVRQAAPPPESD